MTTKKDDQPPRSIDVWVSWDEVNAMLGHTMSRATVRRMMKDGRFPQAIPIKGRGQHPRRYAWVRAEIIEWRRAREKERGSGGYP